jgi:hypothetical protein
MDRATSLRHHLLFNHFPPVRSEWIAIADAAIDKAIGAVTHDGEYMSVDEAVLNEQIGQGKTVREVMDGLHLWDFVNDVVLAEDDEYHDEPKGGE